MTKLTIRELTFIQDNADKMFAHDIATALERPLSFVMSTAKYYKIRVCNVPTPIIERKCKGKTYLDVVVRGKKKSLAVFVYHWLTGSKIPKGYTVVFRDGNSRNCTPANIAAKPISELGIQNQFKPGAKPHNAGTKGKMKPNATSFKKGLLPHNTKPDASITIRTDNGGRQYQFLRLDRSVWVPLHRHTWEQTYGPVPAGHIIVFADGNTMNCELSNLRCISRAENVKRNLNREKQAESMKQAWKVKKTKQRLRKEFPNLFN